MNTIIPFTQLSHTVQETHGTPHNQPISIHIYNHYCSITRVHTCLDYFYIFIPKYAFTYIYTFHTITLTYSFYTIIPSHMHVHIAHQLSYNTHIPITFFMHYYLRCISNLVISYIIQYLIKPYHFTVYHTLLIYSIHITHL